jgi:hypothetical protein
MAEERRDIRSETIGKVLGLQPKPGESISDVKKQAEDIDVVEQTVETAKKLAGTSALEKQLEHKDGQLEKATAEKDKLKDELSASKIELIKGELGGKIDKLAEDIKGGASPKSISDQITEVKKAAESLGLGTSKFSDLKEMMALIQSLNPQRNLSEQVKEARELLTALEPSESKEKGGAVEGIPASIYLQVKQMESNTQLELEKMKDDRQRRDQEFQLTLRRYDEERLSRQEKMQMDYTIQKERNEMIAGAIEGFGRAAGKGYAEALGKGPGEVATQTGEQGKYPVPIKLAEGESGTMECPLCKKPIGVGPTTEVAECIGCHTKFDVVREALETLEEEEQ